MLGRVVSRALTTFGLIAASLAWAGWVYLHTAGDPHRVESTISAVLHDPRSRFEIATAISKQLIDTTGITLVDRTTVAGAVDAALADPRIGDNLVSAVGSEHAHALGIDDPRPTTIDTAAIVAAARDHLAQISPQLAAMLPQVATTPVTLPKFRPPGAAAARTAAQKATAGLAAVAILLVGLSLALGDRRRTLARFATWAIASGIGWVAGPYVLAAIGKHLAPQYANVISTVAHVWTRSITPAAVALMVAGAVAIVLMLVPGFAPSTDDDGRRAPADRYAQGPVATSVTYVMGHGAMAPATATVAQPAPPPARPAPYDTWVPSGGPPTTATGWATTASTPSPVSGWAPVTGWAPASAATPDPAWHDPLWTATAAPATEVADPWAHFFPEAPKPAP